MRLPATGITHQCSDCYNNLSKNLFLIFYSNWSSSEDFFSLLSQLVGDGIGSNSFYNLSYNLSSQKIRKNQLTIPGVALLIAEKEFWCLYD